MTRRKLELPAAPVTLTLGLVIIVLVAVTVAQLRVPAPGPLDSSQPISYFIADGEAERGYRPGDETLAEWALAAWERAAGGTLRFRLSSERAALIRLHWVSASGGQYGEMRPILVDGKRGAVVFVRPETEGLGPDIARLAREDSLFRDTVVYLTCLHEIGHSLGLRHTASYDDIMYFFGHGGDIPNYFSRYYRELTTRDDIQRYSGLSPDDVRRLRELYRH